MNADQVIKEFRAVGITLDQDKARQFVQYYKMLVEWNEKINLTAITDASEVLVKHFIDSVLAYKVYDFEVVSSLVDIGTGAGFPGIPLKIIFPHLQVTLVDALNKRVVYLNEVIQTLELDGIEAIHGRAEDLAKTDMREAFDVSVSRAVSQLNVLCEYCMPFIKVGGTFLSYKGAKTHEELEQSGNAIEILGGEVEMVTDQIELSPDITRGFVLIKKVSATPDKYPRKAGKPLKKPL